MNPHEARSDDAPGVRTSLPKVQTTLQKKRGNKGVEIGSSGFGKLVVDKSTWYWRFNVCVEGELVADSLDDIS